MTIVQSIPCEECRYPGNPYISLESLHQYFLGVRRITGSYDQLFRWDTLEDIPLRS